MTTNPPNLRPDLAPRARITHAPRIGQPTIGMVSLGCPKALVDSERILTRLRAEGYAISPDYAGAGAVIVNTCGFLDSAKAESLDAIGEALRENGKVIVTGCLGAEPDYIREHHPQILAVTGPHQYEQVLDAVHASVPPSPDPYIDLLPASGVTLTPRHYSYLKISEGCNHKCKFCIIPDMRGRLASRPAHAVIREAERLVDAGVKDCWLSARTPPPMAPTSSLPRLTATAPISPILRAISARLARGCGCITSTPTHMCAT
jgi:ribosomal protein S12 methylthiotransferase